MNNVWSIIFFFIGIISYVLGAVALIILFFIIDNPISIGFLGLAMIIIGNESMRKYNLK